MTRLATPAPTPRTRFELKASSVTGRAGVRQAPLRRATVSVVIPNFNYARYLSTAVHSALTQEHAEVEVIIVDDASTDDSIAVATMLEDGDARVRVIARPRNGGPVETFNQGLDAAGGEYLVRLDADDALTPGSLARAIALAEAHPELGLVYGHPVHFEGAMPDSARTRSTGWVTWHGADWLELRCRLGTNCITSPEVMMRMSVVGKVGGQRDLAHTHDMEMWMRIARVSDIGWIAGADQAWHREHPDSLSARQVDVMTEFEERAAAFELLLSDGQGDVEANGRMLALARRALANEALTRTTQAYSAGRGGSHETDGYVAFARRMSPGFDTLPRGRMFDRATRLGRRRAQLSPSLFAAALAHRLSLKTSGVRLRTRGI